MKNIILIAPPAAGKGTISSYLMDTYSYEHISTGDLLREEAKKNSEIASLMREGKLIGDDIILPLFKEKLSCLKDKPFILDGMPRNLEQATYLDTLFNEMNLTNYVVLSLAVEKEILEKRIVGRRICSNCGASYNIYFDTLKPIQEGICDSCASSLITREDDNTESFQVRYKTYLEQTSPLLDFYQEKGKLKVVDGTKNPVEIQQEVTKIIEGSND